MNSILFRSAALGLALSLTSCGSAFLALSSGDDDDPPSRQATAPQPTDGALAVDVLLAAADPVGSLRWAPAPGLIGQRLRFATSAEDLDEDPLFETDVLGPQQSVWELGLTAEQTYFWRVDSGFVENEPLVAGAVWSFTTGAAQAESEPNGGPTSADSLALGRTVSGTLAGSEPDFDWFRVGLQAERLYSVELDALSVDAAGWGALDTLPEIELYDPEANEVLWRHAWPTERFGSGAPTLYAEPIDLAFTQLTVRESGLYFLRLRGVSAGSNGAPGISLPGAGYALRVKALEANVVYEVESPFYSQESGFINDSVIGAELFALTLDDDNHASALLSGYLVSGIDDGGVVGGFDWFRFALPDVGALYAVDVELTAGRMGEYLPGAAGGLGDLELNLFRASGFASTEAVAYDLDSYRGGDPSISLIGVADNSLLRSLFLGVAHNPDRYDGLNPGSTPQAGYSLAGVPFTIAVSTRRLAPETGLVDEGTGDNSTPAGAEPLAYGETLRGNLSATFADTVDWMQFDGVAGDVVAVELIDPNRTFALAGSGTPAEFELNLFRLDGPPQAVPAANTTTDALPENGFNQRRFVQAILTETGTYGLRLENLGPGAGAAGLEYFVTLERVAAGAFESEPNDALAAADPALLTDDSVAGTFSGGGAGSDLDVFELDATEGELLRLTAFGSGDPALVLDLERPGFGGSAEPRLELLDAEGNVLTTASAAPADGFSSAGRLATPLGSLHAVFRAPTDGTYFVRLEDEGAGAGETTRYALRVERE